MKHLLLIFLLFTAVVSAQRTYNTTRLSTGTADWSTGDLINKQNADSDATIVIDKNYNVSISTDGKVFFFDYVLGSFEQLDNGWTYVVMNDEQEYYVICNERIFILIDSKDKGVIFY